MGCAGAKDEEVVGKTSRQDACVRGAFAAFLTKKTLPGLSCPGEAFPLPFMPCFQTTAKESSWENDNLRVRGTGWGVVVAAAAAVAVAVAENFTGCAAGAGTGSSSRWTRNRRGNRCEASAGQSSASALSGFRFQDFNKR
jgi:hypothetical protein